MEKTPRPSRKTPIPYRRNPRKKDPAKLHKAEEIYEKWIKAKITYSDAEKKLKELARKTKAKA